MTVTVAIDTIDTGLSICILGSGLGLTSFVSIIDRFSSSYLRLLHLNSGGYFQNIQCAFDPPCLPETENESEIKS